MCYLLKRLDVIPKDAYDALADYFKGWTMKNSNFMKNVVTHKMRKYE